MNKDLYRPSGDLQGDTASMPYRGSETGCGNDNSDYGADCGQDSTNAMGSIVRDTKSDPADQRFSKGQKNG